jgi:hypothetical protein
MSASEVVRNAQAFAQALTQFREQGLLPGGGVA